MWWLPAASTTCRLTPSRPVCCHISALPGSGEATLDTVTGDSLFPGGPGRVTSPQDFTSLMDDLERRIFDVYDDDTMVHPGHGKPTTLGVERPRLGEWRARGW